MDKIDEIGKMDKNQYVVCNVHKSWFKVSSFEREIGGLMDDIDNKLDNLGQYGGKREKNGQIRTIWTIVGQSILTKLG